VGEMRARWCAMKLGPMPLWSAWPRPRGAEVGLNVLLEGAAVEVGVQ